MSRLEMLFLSFCLIPQLSAQEMLNVHPVEVQEGKVQMGVVVRQDPTQNPKFYIQDDLLPDPSRLRSTSLHPVNLWILVDSSGSCRSKKMDSRLNQLLSSLRTISHRDTVLSVVSYGSSSVEIHHNHRPIKEVRKHFISCESGAHSANPEKALRHLLKSQEKTKLSTHLWVFSSGNIRLSKSVLQQLKERGVKTHITLYNPFVYKEVAPLLRSMRARVGASSFAFSKAGESLEFPAVPYQLDFYPSFSQQGRKINVRILAKVEAEERFSAPLKLNIPDTNLKTIWVQYGRNLFILLVIGVGIYGLVRLIRYYQPRFCKQCERRYRVEDEACLFCRTEGDGYLIGNFEYASRKKLGKRGVRRITRNKIELGTHRKSMVTFPRARKERRKCMATICREDKPGQGTLYRLNVARNTPPHSIKVNGNPVLYSRCLSTGDELVVGRMKLGFYVEVNHA